MKRRAAAKKAAKVTWNLGLAGRALDIAKTESNPIRVMAGPGTGKSYALKRRLARLLEEGADPIGRLGESQLPTQHGHGLGADSFGKGALPRRRTLHSAAPPPVAATPLQSAMPFRFHYQPRPIGDHVPRRGLHFVSQTVGESVIVAVVMKDGPPTITARDDVVNPTEQLQTQRSGHHSGSFGVEKRTNAGYFIGLKTQNRGCPL